MISSLVIRFESVSLLQQARSVLLQTDHCDPGQPVAGTALPMVCEAADRQEMQGLHDRLRELPGVMSVDVVSVFFEPADTFPQTDDIPAR
ncbi:MAG: hypothetical protein KF752_07230 [Pirellulaceae bacterium]|nr:hypothetical protein [Pirellulaceae bacterium]